MPKRPKTRKVYPHPSLARRGYYLAGVGVDGAEVAAELAEEWIAAGLATATRPPVSVRASRPATSAPKRPARAVATKEG